MARLAGTKTSPAPADDVAPESLSGVHRGPLRPGEWVRLTDSKGRLHTITLAPGNRHALLPN